MKVLLALVFSCLLFGAAEAGIIQVMSYNVENLFDTNHDIENGKEKKDWTFLPKKFKGKDEACSNERSKNHRKECLESDWTEAKLNLKIAQIKEVVTKQNTTLPDFLGLVEVENSNVTGMLAKSLGYEHFEMSTSPDERGIDVVLMYKNNKEIKMISRAEHIVPVEYPTRNILEVEFLIGGTYPLTLFVNHWPSLANPDSWRIKAAEVLAGRVQEILKKNPSMNILALGDFNTIDENNPHPFKAVLYKDNLFTDVAQAFMEDKQIDEKIRKSMAPGTYYFSPKDQWNHLDHFFVNRNLINGSDMEISIKSFEIYSPAFLTYDLKKKFYEGEERNVKIVVVPKRFELDGTTRETIGYSDHFPLLVKLEYPETKKTKVKTKPDVLKKKEK
ncbi:MAG: hypothetical protein WC635_03660 [Bacteriovorax sp.]|jgi:endonuclease/exonuclease/phosphatase family metal-dependent hydrolase